MQDEAKVAQKQLNPDREQVGGQHYKVNDNQIQHWNLVIAHDWDYFQAQIIKYVMRWKQKGKIEDLKKAHHFLLKYMDVAGSYMFDSEQPEPNHGDMAIAKRAVEDRLRDAAKKSNGGNQWPHPHQSIQEEGANPGRGYIDQG
jgi:hypothetical protein